MSKRTTNAIKTTGLVLAVLLALTQLWDWFAVPSMHLEAEVTFGSFELPPGLVAEIEGLSELSDEPLLREKLALSSALNFIEDQLTRENAEKSVLNRISWFLRDALPYAVPDPYRSFRGYWSVALSNEGSTTLNAVALTLPNTAYVSISREGEPTTYGPSSSVIRFESIQPRESIAIYAWATMAPHRYYDDEVKLVHSAGVGTISLRSPVAPFWAFFDQYWAVFTIPAAWIFAIATLFGVSAFSSRSKQQEFQAVDTETDDASADT